MTANEFGSGMNDNVRAMLNGPNQIRGPKSVVYIRASHACAQWLQWTLYRISLFGFPSVSR